MKKLLAVLLSGAMSLSLIPAAFAANTTLLNEDFEEGTLEYFSFTDANTYTAVITDDPLDDDNALVLTKGDSTNAASVLDYKFSSSQRGVFEYTFDYYIPIPSDYNKGGIMNSAFMNFMSPSGVLFKMYFNTGAAEVPVGIIRANESGAEDSSTQVTVKAGEWHTAKFIYDTEGTQLDFYNNTDYVGKFDCLKNHAYDFAGTVRQLQFHLRQDKATNRQIMLDNIKLVQLYTDNEAAQADYEQLSLGDTTGITEDIALPTRAAYGSLIEWSTTDATVITADGAVTRDINEDKTVTLTATITRVKGTNIQVTRTKNFECTVKAYGSMENYLTIVADGIATTDLTTENVNMITENLDLTLELPDGVSAEWSTSDEAVISIDGAVTRAATDKEVTVILTLSKDGATYSKSFDFVVLASGSFALMEDFEYTNESGTYLGGLGNWTAAQNTQVSIRLADDPTNAENKAMKIYRSVAETDVYAYNSFGDATGVVSSKMRVYFNPSGNMRTEIIFCQDAVGTQAAVVSLIHRAAGSRQIIFNDDNTTMVEYALPTEEWVDVEAVLDTDRKVLDLYINGQKVNATPVAFRNTEVTKINGMKLNIQRSTANVTAPAGVYFDDILVRELSDEAVVEKAVAVVDIPAYTSEDITLPTVAGASISYTTTDESIVASDGTVTQGDKDKTATLTATFTCGDITKSETYDVCVIGTGILGIFEDFEYGYDDGTNINGIGGWSMGVADGVTAYLDTDDGNKVLHIDRDAPDTTSVFAQRSTSTELSGIVSAQMKLKASRKDMRFNVDILGKSGEKTGNAPEIGIDLKNGTIEAAVDYSETESLNVLQYNGELPEAGEWFDFKVTMYVPDQTYDLFLNGIKINPAPINFRYKANSAYEAVTAISGIKLSINRYEANTTVPADLYIDDLLVRTLDSDAAAVELASSVIGVDGENIISDIDLTTSVYGTTIVWTSDNEAVTSEGTVTRPIGFDDADVILTAEISKGEKSVKNYFNIVVKALPAYEIVKISYKDASDNATPNLTLGGSVGSVTVLKNTTKDEKVKLVVAVYDDVKLESVTIQDVEDGGVITTTTKVPDGLTAPNVKVMIWGGETGIQPLAHSYDSRIMEEVTIYTAGDSTVCNYSENEAPQTGWGMVLNSIFDQHVVAVDNSQPLGGRSAKSFIAEGRLQYIIDNIKAGDYLFIQFGHNDGRIARTDLYASAEEGGAYEKYIQEYVEAARAKGATPVLVTPMVKYEFNDDGTAAHTLKSYSDAMIRVGNKLYVDVLDINALTYKDLSEVDVAITKNYYMISHNDWDTVHLTEAGAKWICDKIGQEIARLGLPIADALISE